MSEFEFESDCSGDITTLEIIRNFGLPVMIGVIASILSFLISWLKDRGDRTRYNRELQIKEATETCHKILQLLDQLHTDMNDYAWDAAKRSHNRSGDKQILEDALDQWHTYQKSLRDWRVNEITLETRLKAFFGDTGYENQLFQECKQVTQQAAGILSKLYLTNSTDVSQKQFCRLMDLLQHNIFYLSKTMVGCILKQDVGNLNGNNYLGVPIPKDHADNREAILAGNTKSISHFDFQAERVKAESYAESV
mmetsp:Transcript_23024/g.33984  ORF Transcript_23024/g.33984 Transcript_23024/m.33984 type:complete len:251 (+) Transcript_23024:189-941(+)